MISGCPGSQVFDGVLIARVQRIGLAARKRSRSGGSPEQPSLHVVLQQLSSFDDASLREVIAHTEGLLEMPEQLL